jgi:hypothetical protein
LAHAQQLHTIESLNASYVSCVQSGLVRRLDDFAVNGNLPQAIERAFLDCQLEENALYTTAVASEPGHSQAIALVRAAIEQVKANLKSELLATPPDDGPKIVPDTHLPTGHAECDQCYRDCQLMCEGLDAVRAGLPSPELHARYDFREAIPR